MMANNNIHPTRIFKTDIELLNAWDQYKQYLIEEAKKWPKIQYVGKDGQRVEDYPVLPYSLDGFEVWYYNNFNKWIHQYFEQKDGYYQDFVSICSHIRKEIRSQQITGGMLGMFNPSITQRLNNLTESTQSKTEGIQKITIERVNKDTNQ
jgi:hypothetical protein